MSDPNLYISLGDCFYGEGEIADRRFIPCGNAAVAGDQACCFQGDFCLSTNVCYDNDSMSSITHPIRWFSAPETDEGNSVCDIYRRMY